MYTKAQIKSSGATFTPQDLADFLANRIIQYLSSSHQAILDPACGTGELLVSLGNKLNEIDFDFSLTGFETDSHYLSKAKERMLFFEKKRIDLFNQDFLEAIDISTNKDIDDLFKISDSKFNCNYNIVIANPPYVRTQLLGSKKAQYYSKKFNLKGRVDLYYPFLIAMTESLVEDGILAVITSNRYLSTKSGESIRKFLAENYEILELLDLGDTKLFDAAVLPAIFIGRKNKQEKNSNAKFVKIYESQNGFNNEVFFFNNIYDILSSEKTGFFSNGKKTYKKSVGILKYSISSTHSWEMLTDEEAQWVSKIDNSAKYRISNFFKVRVGVKSTADKIFISDKWEALGEDKPENELLKDLISQENIEPWGASENLNLKILYPHISCDGKRLTVDIENYSKAKKYLMIHKEILESRKYLIESGRKWYELWVPQNPAFWRLPKLVFPDISSYPRFYFDEGGKIVNGNCYWIVANNLEDVDKLLFIQGISNSKLMTKYHDLVFNNKLYSGRRRYFSQYIEKYPLPNFDSPKASEIISLVKKLNQSSNKSNIASLEKLLEIKVAEAFRVEPIINLD